MRSNFTEEEREPLGSRLWAFALPVAILVVVVAVICGLVLGGVVQGDHTRSGPENVPSTLPTVEIQP
ncbi:MAG TPA: hypothetical protein VJP78_01745 [Thermoleophilia bacterium]|nr:hypothetical protein [Thermoleophilia bacterium]